ncbi:O-methyltransferase [Tengunoibacter tsumagoiensis]|uniref:O-methyltransferase n=1 Tax=Tengunoibacter tsumagoiensis TaxID=2014871 RepID=A0A401ZUV7_9CHLR|nr:O-methyltransferase [Tengunoibacter tsumagoiensis]GCE10576.1 O-methyltransferase [Tengunoibacter tsumagoiensis]
MSYEVAMDDQTWFDPTQLREDAATRAWISRELEGRFAPDDAVLRDSIARAHAENVPAIQVLPLQGKMLHVLALSIGARRILEIGALAGYSGLWLARALPADGKLISLELDPKHAEIARQTFAAAGLSKCTEVRVGAALELLPKLAGEAPFDLIFLDADKASYPRYLEWALKLSRPGTLIVADNIVRGGRAFQNPPPDEHAAGAAEYTRLILADPRLVNAAQAFEGDGKGMDGWSISLVKEL